MSRAERSTQRPLRNRNRHRGRIDEATRGSPLHSNGRAPEPRPARTPFAAHRREVEPAPRISSAANSDRTRELSASQQRARVSPRGKRQPALPRVRRAYHQRAIHVEVLAPLRHSRQATRSRGELARASAPRYRCRVTMLPASKLRQKDRPVSRGRRAVGHFEIEQNLADRHSTDGLGCPAELFSEDETRFGEWSLDEFR